MPDPGGRTGPGCADRSDRIELRGLRLLGRHGLLAEEAAEAQPFEVDLDLFADLGEAAVTDDLALSVDYGGLCQVVREVIEGEHVALLERLAEDVAAGALRFAGPRAFGVEVAVRKLRPPVPVPLASAGVRIFRAAAPASRQEAPEAGPSHGG